MGGVEPIALEVFSPGPTLCTEYVGTLGTRYDRDPAGHRLPADRRRLHPALPASQEVRPGRDVPTAGPILPVPPAEPGHVSELQGLWVHWVQLCVRRLGLQSNVAVCTYTIYILSYV